MKTAEDWNKSVEFEIGKRSGILPIEFIRIIKQIQLDAWKQGMSDAVDLLRSSPAYFRLGQNIAAILQARDEKKEI